MWIRRRDYESILTRLDYLEKDFSSMRIYDYSPTFTYGGAGQVTPQQFWNRFKTLLRWLNISILATEKHMSYEVLEGPRESS